MARRFLFCLIDSAADALIGKTKEYLWPHGTVWEYTIIVRIVYPRILAYYEAATIGHIHRIQYILSSCRLRRAATAAATVCGFIGEKFLEKKMPPFLVSVPTRLFVIFLLILITVAWTYYSNSGFERKDIFNVYLDLCHFVYFYFLFFS